MRTSNQIGSILQHKALISQLIVMILATMVVFSACGGEDDFDQTYDTMYHADRPEYTLCKFVQHLNEAHSNYTGDEIGKDMLRDVDTWVGITRYDANFDNECESYERLMTKYRAEASFNLYNPEGATFESMEIEVDMPSTHCQQPGKAIRHIKVNVKLSDGSGFPVHTMVEIEGAWYILTLQYLI